MDKTRKEKDMDEVETGKPDTTEQYIAAIQTELAEQKEYNKKTMQATRVCMLVLVIMLVITIIAFGFFISLYSTLMQTATELPQLVETLEELAQSAQVGVAQAIEKIKAIDVESANKAIEEIGSLNFDDLNQSIEDLQKGTEAFKTFMEAFQIFNFGN